MESIQEINFHQANMTADLMTDILECGVGNPSVGAPGPLFAAEAVALKAAVSPGLDLSIDDLSVADYDGHAPVAITWSGPYEDENGLPYYRSQVMNFVPTGSDTIGTQTVTGIALENGGNTVLYAAENLDPSVTVEEGRPLSVVVTISIGTPLAIG